MIAQSIVTAQWHSGTVAQWHSGTVAQWLELQTLEINDRQREPGFESCAAESNLVQCFAFYIAPVHSAV